MTVLPLLSRSVVFVPLPNFCVLLLEPSERFVIVPEPNFCVIPVRVLDGGSAAKETAEPTVIARAAASVVDNFIAFPPFP